MSIKTEVKTDNRLINHMRNIKLLQAIYSGKRFFVECYPTDMDAKHYPNSNFAVKEIELPNFDLYEEKLGYSWRKDEPEPKQESEDELWEELVRERLTYLKEWEAPTMVDASTARNYDMFKKDAVPKLKIEIALLKHLKQQFHLSRKNKSK